MKKLEKIRYQPVSVRNLLVEMKNLSELMIDLAYSAALFNSPELAEDVLELENRVDTLSYLLRMNTMIAVRDAKDAENLLGVSIVSSSADKISDAAADIAYIVLNDIGIHPLVREVFEKVEEQLCRTKVSIESTLSGRTLDDLKLASEIGVDVIAIRRANDWIINPQGNELVMKGDLIIARGTSTGIGELRKLARGCMVKKEG